jgi:prokaryotic ubiquitin-like protein Pup
MSESIRQSKTSSKEGQSELATEQSGGHNSAELVDALDDILDQIDEVLEQNAEEFVKNYVQKGGQ